MRVSVPVFEPLISNVKFCAVNVGMRRRSGGSKKSGGLAISFEKRLNCFILVGMTTFSIQELPPTTIEAIKRALAEGEDVFITNDRHEPLAQVVSVHDGATWLSDEPIRKGGFAKGRIHLSDNWDSLETNDEIAREFGMLD